MSPWREEFANWKDVEPLNVLPPVFGTTFINGPPVSASPRPPEVRNVISCTFAVSTEYPDTPPPPRDAPTFMPSTCSRPSVVGPPWMPNSTMPGVSCTVFGSPVMPGISSMIPFQLLAAGVFATRSPLRIC